MLYMSCHLHETWSEMEQSKVPKWDASRKWVISFRYQINKPASECHLLKMGGYIA